MTRNSSSRGHKQVYSEAGATFGADGKIAKHLGRSTVSLQGDECTDETTKVYYVEVSISTVFCFTRSIIIPPDSNTHHHFFLDARYFDACMSEY